MSTAEEFFHACIQIEREAQEKGHPPVPPFGNVIGKTNEEVMAEVMETIRAS
jgi:hypothetical protein